MNNQPKLASRLIHRELFPRAALMAALLFIITLDAHNAGATFYQWNTGNGQWTNTTQWTPNGQPGVADTASFNDSTLANGDIVTLNSNPLTAFQVGSIYVGSGISGNFSIRNQSSAPALTTLNLNGVGGILISNISANYQVTFTNTAVAGGTLLNLGIVSNGVIYAANGTGLTPPADGSGGEIVIYSVVTGPGSITNAGPGILDMLGVNTYSGSTTLSAGSLELGGSGTLGNGAGTLYFSGGNLESGGSRTTDILNPIVVTTTGYIFSQVASANSTRIFPLSGSLSGTSGTLIIANPNTAANEIFDVELLGSFTFNLPLVVGDNLGDSFNDDTINGTYGEVELANYPSNGIQTFNGDISGDGPVIRSSLTTAPGGISVFTGSNSYTGGTLISSGTLFANNTAGSALGSGNVTVTNKGTLAGNGIVVAPTTINLNGTIQPGPTTNTIGNLSMSSGLTFSAGANYMWQISSASGAPGTTWDLITCSNGWTDAGNNTTPITVYITSEGLAPTGWNDANSYTWTIIENNGNSTGFNAGHFTINTSAFGGNIAGAFDVTSDGNGDLLLTYTPTSGNIVINVPTGQSVSQGGVSPTPYPIITGLDSVTKVGNGEVIMTNSLNSYEGATYISAGTASAAVNSGTSGGAFGASTSPLILGDTSGNSNATLNIDQPGVLVANAVTVQAGSSGAKTIGTTITTGQATFSGNVTLNDNVTLSSSSGSAVSFGGNFSGVGGITFVGGGTNMMGGVGSYSGPTTLTGGALDLDASALGTNTFSISGVSTLDNVSGGSVTLNNNPPMIWNTNFSFTGSADLNLGLGSVTMNANPTLTVSSNILTVGGVIAGNYGLTLTGAGELLLAGPTNNTYTGGTTNFGDVLGINGTATFGNGAGPLVFSGAPTVTNYLLDTGSRAGLPIANPVIINTTTRVYGDSTDTASPTRVLPFSGPFTVAGGASLIIDDIGSATTIFNLRLFATNASTSYMNINWPIVIGDPTFDTPNTTCQLDLQNDDTTAPVILSGIISGTGQILRSGPLLNTGGSAILTAQNTFSGGVELYSGSLGLGASSVMSGGVVVSGPLGAGTLTFGDETAETALTVFATVGPTLEIDNSLFFDGDTNMVFAGTNNLLFTGALNSGGVAKTITVTNGITATFSGAITNTGSSDGGALTKAGGGTLVLSGNDTYSGTTTVNAGTLLVNGTLNTNTVTANSGGTFGGTGSLGGNLLFNAGAQGYLFKTAGSADSPLNVAGNLTVNGNTVVVDMGGATTLGPGTYDLLNYSGTLSGSFNTSPVIVDGSLEGGHGATISESTANEITLVVAPSSAAPKFNGVTISNGSLVLGGTNGTANATYTVLTSTNLLLPLSSWIPLTTNTFDGSGNFSFTNSHNAQPQQFFIIQY